MAKNAPVKSKHADEIEFVFPGAWKRSEEDLFSISHHVMFPFSSPSRAWNDFGIANNTSIRFPSWEATGIEKVGKETPFLNMATKMTSLEKKERPSGLNEVATYSSLTEKDPTVNIEIPSFYFRDLAINQWIDSDRFSNTNDAFFSSMRNRYMKHYDEMNVDVLKDLHAADIVGSNVLLLQKETEINVDKLMDKERKIWMTRNNPKTKAKQYLQNEEEFKKLREEMLSFVKKSEPTPGLKKLINVADPSHLFFGGRPHVQPSEDIVKMALSKSIIGIMNAAKELANETPVFKFVANEFTSISKLIENRKKIDGGQYHDSYAIFTSDVSSMKGGLEMQLLLDGIKKDDSQGYKMADFLKEKGGNMVWTHLDAFGLP